VSIDERLIGALHVESFRRADRAGGPAPHEVFQTSTIAALLDGAYEGDVSLRELANHGDLGLGTFDALDGEMTYLDGDFLRADVHGEVHPIDPERTTPFAVVTFFRPTHRVELATPRDQEHLLAAIDDELGDVSRVHAVRIDGRFERVRARSVAAQRKPYPPLTEVARGQHVFELADVEGTAVGFRFPDPAASLNVTGWHIHFVDADRARGGHVLDCRTASVRVEADDVTEVRAELPPGVDLSAARPADADAIDRVEREG
jgi:acetolactate decarboxylase